MMLWFATILVYLFFAVNTYGACNCGSTNASAPCTGQSITVTVVAGTPNGGTAVDNSYSWAFNSGGGDARCGQFANGDYWVAPASGQTSVTLTGVSSASHAGLITADDNPKLESLGLLSTSTMANHDAAQNIIPSLPISYSTMTTVLAAIQRNTAVEGACQAAGMTTCVDSYNAVTFLTAVPENAGVTVLRPNIVGETRELISLSSLDLSKIPSKSYLNGTTSAGLETIRKRWSHHSEVFSVSNSVCTTATYCSEGGIAFRAHTMVGGYGGAMASQFFNDLMILFSDDHTIAAKTPALAAMLSFGNDLYHTIFDPPAGYTRSWGIGATQHPGKITSVALLAALLTDPAKANTVKTVKDHLRDSVSSGPHELGQVTDGSNGPVWGDYDDTQGGYWHELIESACYDGGVNDGVACPYVTGKRTGRDPYGYIDGPAMIPGGGYLPSTLGVQRAMVATMFLMPEVCDVVNYDPLVEYVDRAATVGVQTANDPCVTPDSREDLDACDPYRNQGCVYYGVTWGPVDVTDASKGCITTPTPPYTKQGRFTNNHGAPIGATYTSAQVESNWATIRGAADGCRTTTRRPLRVSPTKMMRVGGKLATFLSTTVAPATPASITQSATLPTLNDETVTYTFTSTTPGTIVYGGACGATDTATAVAGANQVTWTLPNGIYTNCTVAVQNDGGSSNVLAVPTFESTSKYPVVFVHGLYGDGVTAWSTAEAYLVNLGWRSQVLVNPTMTVSNNVLCEPAQVPVVAGWIQATLDALPGFAKVDLVGHSRGGSNIMRGLWHGGIDASKVRRVVTLSGANRACTTEYPAVPADETPGTVDYSVYWSTGDTNVPYSITYVTGSYMENLVTPDHAGMKEDAIALESLRKSLMGEVP